MALCCSIGSESDVEVLARKNDAQSLNMFGHSNCSRVALPDSDHDSCRDKSGFRKASVDTVDTEAELTHCDDAVSDSSGESESTISASLPSSPAIITAAITGHRPA